MEIKVYINFDAYSHRKPILCNRVAHPEDFDFIAVKSTLKCMFGDNIVLEFVCE